MTILNKEIPYTTAGLKLYIDRIQKHINELSAEGAESRRLEKRLKEARTRLLERSVS